MGFWEAVGSLVSFNPQRFLLETLIIRKAHILASDVDLMVAKVVPLVSSFKIKYVISELLRIRTLLV